MGDFKIFMLCYFTMWGKWDFPKVGTRAKRNFRTISCKAHLHIIAAVLDYSPTISVQWKTINLHNQDIEILGNPSRPFAALS